MHQTARVFQLLLLVLGLLPSWSWVQFPAAASLLLLRPLLPSQHSSTSSFSSPVQPRLLSPSRPPLFAIPSSSSPTPGPVLPPPLQSFLTSFLSSPSTHSFSSLQSALSSSFDFVPVPFLNGRVYNDAGDNGWSARLLSFAIEAGLTDGSTAMLWGEHYRDVVGNPGGKDHENIRSFLEYGMAGVKFPEGLAIRRKKGV